MTEDLSCLLKVGNSVNKNSRIFKLQKSQVSAESEDTYVLSPNDISNLNAILGQIGKTGTTKDVKEQLEVDKAKSVVLAEVDGNGKENETTPLTLLLSQQEILLRRAKQVQNGLQKKMKDALETKKKEFEQKLLNQSMAFEMILMNKEREQILLMQQIKDTKKEMETAQLQTLRAKEDVISNFVELMGVNLQCSICREYLVKATALNCSHVFCKLCIKQWIKVKNICPNCRTPITSHIQIPAMDNCIEKMIEQLSDELKRRRIDFVKQRKIEQDGFDGAESGNLNARNALLRMRGGGVQVAAALRRAAAQATIAARIGAATFRRAAAHTKAAACTGAQELSRSAVVRRAAALTRAAALSGSQALIGAQEFTKSAVLRRAAAFTRAAAVSGSKVFRRSTVFERASAFVKIAVLRGSEVLTRSEITRRAMALTRAVAEMLPRNPTVRKAMELTRAAIRRTVASKKARAVTEAIEIMKTTALRKAAEVARTAAIIRASTSARLAALKNPDASTRRRVRRGTRANATTAAVPSTNSPTFRGASCGLDRNGCSFRSWNIALSFSIGSQ